MIEAVNLKKSFQNGDLITEVLKGVNLRVESGEFVAIMGRSGAGKSTLMYHLSLLDTPTSGEVLVEGKPTALLSENQKSHIRLMQFGYVFQDYALLPELTAVENVAIPLLMQDMQHARAHKEAAASLVRVGLGHRLNNTPSQLSGGEQQRVSIARAVAHNPKILFADEPTANLDRASSTNVMEIFAELHRAGQTIIMVTHEEEYAQGADRLIRLDDGLIKQ